jgi:phage baseplate assembly protein W
MSEILGTGIAFPLGVDARGRVAFAHDETDIDQAIGLIIDTRPGERPMRPEFGCSVHDSVFERVDAQTTGKIEEAIRSALDRWEPRIEVERIGFDLDEPGVLRIEIAYRVRATNSPRNLVHPFYVIPAENAP